MSRFNVRKRVVDHIVDHQIENLKDYFKDKKLEEPIELYAWLKINNPLKTVEDSLAALTLYGITDVTKGMFKKLLDLKKHLEDEGK